MKYLLLLALLFTLAGVSASNYSIEFNQIDNDLVVREYLNSVISDQYVLSNELSDSDSGHYFIERVVAKDNYSFFSVILNFDSDVSIENEEIFPVGYIFETDGRIISVRWEYENVSKNDSFAFFVSLDTHEFNLFCYIILFIVFISLIVLVIFYLKKTSKLDKYLLDEERNILKFLKGEEKRESWQKKIQTQFSLSKAKCSRLIRNLESRGLIEKIPFGNTNKIRLK
jgi:hypothetical protein